MGFGIEICLGRPYSPLGQTTWSICGRNHYQMKATVLFKAKVLNELRITRRQRRYCFLSKSSFETKKIKHKIVTIIYSNARTITNNTGCLRSSWRNTVQLEIIRLRHHTVHKLPCSARCYKSYYLQWGNFCNLKITTVLR